MTKFQELRNYVKNNGGSEVFGNYTQLSTEELEKLVKKYQNKANTRTSSKTKVNTPKEVEKQDNGAIVAEIQGLLKQAIKQLEKLPERESEAQRLHNQAMAIEAELVELGLI